MCLLFPWYTGSLAKQMVDLLSQYKGIEYLLFPCSSSRIPFNHIPWHPAKVSAMYSASVEERATTFCFFDCHDMGPEPR
ncbi:hypothetical protein HanRHA438_Chr02g0063031 [Helianthus annuus]|nr:hypothetical protein HanRHA438_Chr02g0063031 [Helianthus annuus]